VRKICTLGFNTKIAGLRKKFAGELPLITGVSVFLFAHMRTHAAGEIWLEARSCGISKFLVSLISPYEFEFMAWSTHKFSTSEKDARKSVFIHTYHAGFTSQRILGCKSFHTTYGHPRS